MGTGFPTWDARNSSHSGETILALLSVGRIAFILDRLIAAAWGSAAQRANKLRQGRYVSLFQRSGGGNLVLPNIVAGLLRASTGGMLLEGRELDTTGADRTVVLQNNSVLPRLTVRDDVALDEEFNGATSEGERRGRIDLDLPRSSIVHATAKRPAEISGGVKPRLAASGPAVPKVRQDRDAGASGWRQLRRDPGQVGRSRTPFARMPRWISELPP